MFRLRKEHSDALRRQALADFEARAVRHLREHLPGPTATYSDEELLRRVRRAVPRARQHGLLTQRQVVRFLDVTFLLAEGFDQDPRYEWAAVLLRSTKLSAEARSILLLAVAASVHGGAQAGRA